MLFELVFSSWSTFSIPVWSLFPAVFISGLPVKIICFSKRISLAVVADVLFLVLLFLFPFSPFWLSMVSVSGKIPLVGPIVLRTTVTGKLSLDVCENYEFSILLGYRTSDRRQTIGRNNGFQYRETIDDPTTFYWRICHRYFHFTNQSLFFIWSLFAINHLDSLACYIT